MQNETQSAAASLGSQSGSQFVVAIQPCAPSAHFAAFAMKQLCLVLEGGAGEP
jgi:hypothetical protein